MRRLGWINIDRLFTDPRTREIELVVSVENYSNYDTIYTSMIFKNQRMYLPGYQRKDKTFSFTHHDDEPTSLPVNEMATILVTAYNTGVPYYAIKTFTIKEKQKINLVLAETTKKSLKSTLAKEL